MSAAQNRTQSQGPKQALPSYGQISEKTMLAVQSIRSNTAKDCQSFRQVVMESIPDTQYNKVDESTAFAVQVKKVPRKGHHLSRRVPHSFKNSAKDQAVQSKAQAAVYEGTTSSPHIKPEYLNARLKSSAINMRARSTGPGLIPMVKGMAMAQQMRDSQLFLHRYVEETNQKLQAFKRESNRHHHAVVAQASSKSRSQASNEINKDIASVEGARKPPILHRGQIHNQMIPMTQLQTSIDSESGHITVNPNKQPQHMINVSVNKDRRSFIETDASGGSGMHLSTIYDNTSPARIGKQQTSQTNPSSLHQSRERMGGKGEYNRLAASKNLQDSKQSSHVQLTQFLNNHKIQQQLQIQMAEHQIGESSNQPSQEKISQQSLDPNMTNSKVTDYNATSPQVLLPKLNPQGLVQIAGEGRTAAASNNATQQQETASNSDGMAFANMVNSTTKSEMEMCSELQDQQLNEEGFELTTTPLNMHLPLKRGPGHYNEQQMPHPFTVSQPWGNKDLDRGNVLVQKGRKLLESVDKCAYFSITAQGNDFKSQARTAEEKNRTKSVMLSNHNIHAKRPNLLNASENQKKQQQPSQPDLDTAGFRIVAQRKQVVPNMKAEQQNWQRKRNAMSKNEIKRQSTLLNNLPIIGKKKNEPKVMTSPRKEELAEELPDKVGTSYIEEQQPRKDTAPGVESKMVTQNNWFSIVEPNEATQPTNIRLSTSNEVNTLNADFKEASKREPTPDYIDSREMLKPNQEQVVFLKPRKEEVAITTDKAESLPLSREAESMNQQSKNMLKRVNRWNKQVIQIGSQDKRCVSQERQSGAGRRLNTSHEANVVTSLDGTLVMMRKGRGERPNLDIRNNQSQSHNLVTDLRQTTQHLGDGKPTTAAEFQRRVRIEHVSRLAEIGAKRSSIPRANQNRSSTNYMSTRAAKNRQRQIKDIMNLGDIRSQHLKDIKISRLNDLGMKDDGNPLKDMKMLQDLQEKRASILLYGGTHTQALVEYNTRLKYQTDAIQDFTGKQSRFNSTDVGCPGDQQRMTLKKLIGREAILLPDKLQRSERLNFSKQCTSRVDDRDSSKSATSRESFEQKFHVTMMRQLLHDQKVTLMEDTKPSPRAVVVNRVAEDGSKLKEKKDLSLNHTALDEPETLLDEMSPKMEDSSIMTVNNSILSPMCNQIKLMPKAKDNHKRILDEIAQKSRQMAKANRSRAQTNQSERQSVTRNPQNKDMEEMLNDIHNQLSSLRDATTSDQDNKSTKVQQTAKPVKESSNESQTARTRAPVKKLSKQLVAKVHERLDSSDVEDNASNSQLNPMGIDEQPEHAYAERRRSSVDYTKVDKIQEESLVYTQSDEKFRKQQVYSHYDETPQTKSRLEGFASDTALGKAPNLVEGAALGAINQARSSLQHESMIKRQQPSQDDYSALMGIVQKDLHAPVISVTSVKIQKTKSLLNQSSEHKKKQANFKGTAVQGNGKSLIKHVDQSLEQQDITSAGKDTVVRQSYHQSSGQAEKMPANSGQRYSSTNNIPNVGYKQILPKSVQTDAEVMSATRQPHPHMETLQHASTNRESETLTKERWQSPLLERKRLNSDKANSGTGNVESQGIVNLGSKGEFPQMLDLISKKQECLATSPGLRKNKDRHRESPERERVNSLTLQSDILEQLNAFNSVLAPHLTSNGYHQLEPKLFAANMKAQQFKRVTPSSEAPSGNQAPNPRLASTAVKKRLNTKRSSNDASTSNLAPVLKQPQPTPAFPPYEPEEEEEIGFVSHAAIESRLHGLRQTKLLMEQRKREWARQQKEFASIEYQTQNANGVSVLGSHQFQRDQQAGSTSVEEQNVRPGFNSMIDVSFARSPKPGQSVYCPQESLFKSRMENELAGRASPAEDESFSLRQIKKVEKDISKCINIEKIMHRPIEQVQSAIQELIGTQKTQNQYSDSAVTSEQDSKQFSFKPKRRGLMRLSSIQLCELYKDHFVYEFVENELHQLLGEQVEPSSVTKRYFLKFTSLQIVNIDCQSGIVSDIEPISIPMSKMINLFFLSSDQLQQVLCQSLCLRREDNSGGVKLQLDSELLREKIRKTTPRVIREDYYSAPLQVNVLETIEGHNLIKDSFNLEIRLPRFEIVTTSQEVNRVDPAQPLFKTTMTHNLTGMQMVHILQRYNLLDWADFAKTLITQRTFGVDSMQADGDASIIKFQRINYNGELVLYKDPEQLKQEISIAQNLQLTMMLQDKFTVHFEYLRPLYIKLVVDDRELFEDLSRDLLPGYLPKSAKRKAKAKTVAFMHIPFIKLPFIKQTFGDKIQEGEGSFLECLYDLVELQIDTKRDILRLAIPSWRRLEEMNIRQLSQKYYLQQQMNSQAQQENNKYRTRKVQGEVKALIENGGSLNKTQAPVARLTMLGSQDYSSVSQMQSSTQETHQRSVFHKIGHRTSVSVKHSTPAQQVKAPAMMSPSKLQDSLEPLVIPGVDPQKRLQVKDLMHCKLKICRLTKAVYALDFAPDSSDSVKKALVSRYDASKKVSLSEIFGPQQPVIQ